MSKSPPFAYGVRSADSHGLDPERFEVVISVSRKNFAPLSPKDIATVEAALAPLAAPAPQPKRGNPLAGTTGKTRKLVSQLSELATAKEPRRTKRAAAPAKRRAARTSKR